MIWRKRHVQKAEQKGKVGAVEVLAMELAGCEPRRSRLNSQPSLVT
jgi:hypothetical protein